VMRVLLLHGAATVRVLHGSGLRSGHYGSRSGLKYILLLLKIDF
jgi:hypothetical protein